MTRLLLVSPLAGWALPIEEVPDPAFAQRLVGDGVAIDPTQGLLHAPCAGRVLSVAPSGHALTLRSDEGLEILLHIGVDTVALAGAGFTPLVAANAQVLAGQPLLRFDLDLIARRAPSLVTPVLLPSGGRVVRSEPNRALAVGDFLMEVEFDATAPQAGAGDAEGVLSRSFRLAFEHGLHARPAAQLAATARRFPQTRLRVRARGGEADAMSTTALMALGTARGDRIEVVASGANALAALEAIAALLGADAEPAAVVTPAVAGAPGAASAEPGRLRGSIASRGLALGEAWQARAPVLQFAERADDAPRECAALERAIADTNARLATRALGYADTAREVLEAHAELVLDPGLFNVARVGIEGGASAAAAWRDALDAAVQSISGLADARMRERVADLRDIERQVQLALAGVSASSAAMPARAIVLADELLPSQLLELPLERVAGLCMARGGPTSHVALIASSFGLPALVAMGPALLDVADGSKLLLDADAGSLRVEPDADELQRFSELLEARRRREDADLAAAAQPASTRDGTRVAVLANLGSVEDASAAIERGAEGCGLLRTEFLFLDRASAPDEAEQFEQYRQILQRLGSLPLTIRTLDLGGDKPIPYLPLPAEDNPALGLRGLRTSLAHPQLMKTQLRAILRLREPGRVRILLPMVTEPGDVRALRAVLRECADELGIEALPPLGAMIETPASALLAGALAREADFFSIGSNDLSQYTLAIDRGHPQLSSRLDALHPAVLRLIDAAASAAHANGREVAVCGGLASDPQAIVLLLGLGIRELSALPRMVPAVKRIVRTLDLRACRELAREALQLEDAPAVRRLVAAATPAGTQKEETA
jgi:phosphoenolpyruvate-protein phosphotransferase